MLGDKEILNLASQSLTLVLKGSLPSIAAAAVAGVAIALVQALTQIQDQGLPTAVKFFAVLFVLFLTYVSTASSIAVFTTAIFALIQTI
ncbi:MAG: Bacterial export protein family 3 [Pseudomonadota bacterium]|jgi:type III secretory pathway component EscS